SLMLAPVAPHRTSRDISTNFYVCCGFRLGLSVQFHQAGFPEIVCIIKRAVFDGTNLGHAIFPAVIRNCDAAVQISGAAEAKETWVLGTFIAKSRAYISVTVQHGLARTRRPIGNGLAKLFLP